MPIMESTKTESTAMTDGEIILWLITKGTMEDRPVLHLAADRVQTLLAEREDLVECNEQFSVDNQFLKKRAEKAEADNARLRGRPAASVPDYCYDDEWESTMPWDLRNELVEFADLTTPVPVYTLFKGPTQWAVNIPIDTDGDGEADDFEPAWFDSEAEALAAQKGPRDD